MKPTTLPDRPESDMVVPFRRQSNIPSLVCAFSASATTGGSIYAFGIFANDLKHNLGLTQLQLDKVSAAFFVAGLLSWIPGIVVDRMKMRFSMALGGFSGAFFTLLYWSVCRYPHLYFRSTVGDHQGHVVAVLFVLAIAISFSCGLIVGSTFKLTMLCGGPHGKGPAVGIAKGLVGVGSGVYATIFQALRGPDESALDFLPVIATFFIVCAAFPAMVLLPRRDQFHPHLMAIEMTTWHFQTMYVMLFVLCLVLVACALSDIFFGDQQRGGPQYGKVVLVLMLWLGPIVSLLYLPRKQEQEEHENASLLPGNEFQQPEGKHDSYGSTTATNPEKLPQEVEQQGAPITSTPVSPRVVELNLPEMLQTPSAWLMLWTTAVLVGSGTTKTNNMGEMVESLQLAQVVTPATLALFSVAQAAGRILTSVFSEEALQRYRVPRPLFLVLASIVMLIAHVMLATTGNLVGFVAGCTVSAVAFGMSWPLMVLIVGDIFGVEHHGANYLFFDGVTKALGTMFLSQYVAGTVYEAHIDVEDGQGGDEFTCFGMKCFQGTHLVIAGLSLTCIASSLILWRITKQAYSIKT